MYRNTIHKIIFSTALLFSLLATTTLPALAQGKAKQPKLRAYKHPVTVWVPPYSIAKSREQLMASWGGTGVKNGITHLDLQFWVPTKEGKAKLVGFSEVNESVITELRDWAHANGIRVMLCIYNGAEKWDWDLAKAGFAEHPKEFVESLIAETERLQLDGVDIDLEGPGSYDADKGAYIAFMTTLSQELHRRGKHLTVDTFQSAKWNAPNQSWWPELFPLVDALASMGYDDSGMNAPEWRAYSEQKKTAGPHVAKLQLGIPSFKDKWRGNTAQEQLQWIKTDGTMGIAIWDAQFPATAWTTPEVWHEISAIREGKK